MSRVAASRVAAPRRRKAQTREISEKEWAALLADPVTGTLYLGGDRRSGQRFFHRHVMHLSMAITWTGRARKRFLVRTRDIGFYGLGFLHSQPCARGSRCRISLLTIDSRLVHIDGKIAWCAQRKDGLYAIGVTFDIPVDLAKYIPDPRATQK